MQTPNKLSNGIVLRTIGKFNLMLCIVVFCLVGQGAFAQCGGPLPPGGPILHQIGHRISHAIRGDLCGRCHRYHVYGSRCYNGGYWVAMPQPVMVAPSCPQPGVIVEQGYVGGYSGGVQLPPERRLAGYTQTHKRKCLQVDVDNVPSSVPDEVMYQTVDTAKTMFDASDAAIKRFVTSRLGGQTRVIIKRWTEVVEVKDIPVSRPSASTYENGFSSPESLENGGGMVVQRGGVFPFGTEPPGSTGDRVYITSSGHSAIGIPDSRFYDEARPHWGHGGYAYPLSTIQGPRPFGR